jgi:hypothetical protein
MCKLELFRVRHVLAQVRHLETIFDHFVTEVREYEPQKAICIQKSM